MQIMYIVPLKVETLLSFWIGERLEGEDHINSTFPGSRSKSDNELETGGLHNADAFVDPPVSSAES
jgi:hypothetical protein